VEEKNLTSLSANEGAAASEATGFEPRESFEAALFRETAFARRHEIRLALFLIEVDGLAKATVKTVAELARALRGLNHVEVVLAQLSPEVCALVLRGIDPAAAAVEAERVAAAIAALPGVNLAATIGVATFHASHASTSDALFHAAEVALLAAKKQGKGRSVVQSDGLPAPAATPPT
jgi:GGDEF domain-containing protein